MTEDDATLFAVLKASGLPASLKGEILCHNSLGWGHVAKDKSGKPVCPSAVEPRRPGECVNGVRFPKFRGNHSDSRPACPGGHRHQQYKGSSGDKPKFKHMRFKCLKLKSKKCNKTYMLGTDDEGNFFSLDSSLDIFSENDDGDYDDDFANSPGEFEMNAVTTDVDSTPRPASDDWQAALFGVIPPPASAVAAWTDDCCDIDMCTDPT
eukprot:2144602-Pleurochrysis_carterae.AAC.1